MANGEAELAEIDCTRVVLNSEDDHDPCRAGRDENWDAVAEEEVDSALAGGFSTETPQSAHVTWVWLVLPGIV